MTDQESDAMREVFPNVVGNGCLVKVKGIVTENVVLGCKLGQNKLFLQGMLVPGGERGWKPDLGIQGY